MSKISEQLKKYAQEEKSIHQEYIKDFSTATIATLVEGGLDRKEANMLAKQACLKDEELVKSVNRSIILEKVAEYIETLEDENAKLHAKISTSSENNEEVEKQAELPANLKSLETVGFTRDEINALSGVSQELVEKVASISTQPWEMGKGVGPSIDRSDPLLAWIMS